MRVRCESASYGSTSLTAQRWLGGRGGLTRLRRGPGSCFLEACPARLRRTASPPAPLPLMASISPHEAGLVGTPRLSKVLAACTSWSMNRPQPSHRLMRSASLGLPPPRRRSTSWSERGTGRQRSGQAPGGLGTELVPYCPEGSARLPQPPAADHPGHVQILRHHRLVSSGQHRGHLVHGIETAVGDLGMEPGEELGALRAVGGALLLAGAGGGPGPPALGGPLRRSGSRPLTLDLGGEGREPTLSGAGHGSGAGPGLSLRDLPRQRLGGLVAPKLRPGSWLLSTRRSRALVANSCPACSRGSGPSKWPSRRQRRSWWWRRRPGRT